MIVKVNGLVHTLVFEFFFSFLLHYFSYAQKSVYYSGFTVHSLLEQSVKITAFTRLACFHFIWLTITTQSTLSQLFLNLIFSTCRGASRIFKVGWHKLCQ